MNYLKKLAGQSLVYGLGTIVPRLLNFAILTPFYTRVFGKAEYGIISELYAYIVVFMVILTYGLETSFFRFTNKNRDKKSVIYSTLSISLIFTSILFVLLIYTNLLPIANAIDYGDKPQYILWCSLILGIDAFTSLPFALLRLQGKVRKFSLIKVANIFFILIVSFVVLKFAREYEGDNTFIKWLYNPEIGVGYVFLINLFGSVISFILLFKEIFSISFKFDFSLYKNVLFYSFPLLISGLAGSINEAIDRILLKHFSADPTIAMETVGVYGANYKLAVFMTLYIQMFKYAVEPFFFEQAKNSDAKTMYSTILNYFFILGLIIFLGITVYIDIFKHFLGSSFHEGIAIVPVVLLANLFLGVFYNLSVWYKINDLTKIGAYITLSGSIITIVSNFILIPRIGYMGSAVTHLICYSFMVVLSYLLSKKFYFIKYPIYKLLGYLVIALLIFVISNYMLINLNIILSFILRTALFALFIIFINYKEKLLHTFILK